MKNKFLVATLCLSFLSVPLCGCGQTSDTESEQGIVSSAVREEETFDIEVVRTNIVIGGQHFEVPIKLSELGKNWSYECYDAEKYYLNPGAGLAQLFYDGEKIIDVGLENYYSDKEEEAIVYNLSVDSFKDSIDDLFLGKTTKQNVLEKYGQPNGTLKRSDNSGEVYYYGTPYNDNKAGSVLKNRCLTVSFNEEDIIKSISITYADID